MTDEHHAHHHRPAPGGSLAFAVAVVLNTLFAVVELVFGLLSGSVALLADAAHNLSDVLGLLLAWGAERLARRRPTGRRTYGMAKATVLAALSNAILILLAAGGVVFEAVRRIGAPPRVDGATVMVVAAIGVVINLGSAFLFSHRDHDANQRAAWLHLITDALVSVGVVAGGAVVWLTGWDVVDPLLSIGIAAVIVIMAWRLLRDAFDLATDAVPRDIDPAAVRGVLEAVHGVVAVHELHIWPMSTTQVALTAHLEMNLSHWSKNMLDDICERLRSEFGIDHVTLQPEPARVPSPQSEEAP